MCEKNIENMSLSKIKGHSKKKVRLKVEAFLFCSF